MTTTTNEAGSSNAPPNAFGWPRRLSTHLGVLACALAALVLMGAVVTLCLPGVPTPETRRDLLWPYGFLDVLWLVTVSAACWAAVRLTRSEPLARRSLPLPPRFLTRYGAVSWLLLGTAGGVSAWSTPIRSSSLNVSLATEGLHTLAEVAKYSTCIGVLWILLVLDRWRQARTAANRRYLWAATTLSAASIVVAATHFALYLRRNRQLAAIIEGRASNLSEWPSRAPVEHAGAIAALLGLVALLATLLVLLRIRRQIHRDPDPEHTRTLPPL